MKPLSPPSLSLPSPRPLSLFYLCLYCSVFYMCTHVQTPSYCCECVVCIALVLLLFPLVLCFPYKHCWGVPFHHIVLCHNSKNDCHYFYFPFFSSPFLFPPPTPLSPSLSFSSLSLPSLPPPSLSLPSLLLSPSQVMEENWRAGSHTLTRIQCHSENSKGVYCLQYDDEKIVSGLRDNTIKVLVHLSCMYITCTHLYTCTS